MSTPLERLTAIVAAFQPSEVKFQLATHNDKKRSLLFESVVVKESVLTPPPEDVELYALMKTYLTETWNPDEAKFVMNTTVESLWYTVSRLVCARYEDNSSRCAATKRKTTDFIHKIKADDKLLAGFLLQTFMTLQSNTYKNMSGKEREALFEQFDSLRRTFGKRV